MVCPSAVHLNPAKYNDPLAFDPWRWEVPDFLAFYFLWSWIFSVTHLDSFDELKKTERGKNYMLGLRIS